MSSSRVLVRNISANWIGFASQVAVTFFLTPFILQSLGHERYGVWTIVMSITGYYGLLDLGFRASLTQYLTRYLATANYDELNRSASTSFVANSIAGCIVLVASAACAAAAPLLFKIPNELASDVRWAIVVVGLGAALQFPFFVFSSVFVATQRYDLANVIGVTTRLAQAGGFVIALSLGYGLTGLSIALLATNSVDYLLRWWLALRLIPQLDVTPRRACFENIRELLNFGIWNSLIGGSRRVMSYADSIIIGMYLPVAAVTPFALATSLAAYLDHFLVPAARVFFPEATRLHARGEHDSLRNLFLSGSRLMLSLAVVGAVIASIWARDFFALWVGQEIETNDYSPPSTLFIVLVIAATLTTGQRIGNQVLLGSLVLRPLALLLFLETGVNVVVSVFLLPSLGLMGVAIGTLLAAAIFQGLLHPLLLCQTLKIRPYVYLSSVVLRPVLVGICVGMTCWVIKWELPHADSWRILLLHGGCATATSLGLLGFVGLSREERTRFIYDRFRRSTRDRLPNEACPTVTPTTCFESSGLVSATQQSKPDDLCFGSAGNGISQCPS